MRNKKRGFTLIELLFVLAIITVVVTTTVVSYVSISGKQKEKDYQTMISNIRTSSEVYLSKNSIVNIALKEQGYVSLSVEQLVREGLLNEYYTVNPKTKESMIGKCIIITLESEENKYNFSTPIPCGSYLSMETLNINNSQIQDNIDILYDKINVIDERGIRIISEEEDKLSEKKELIEIISINGKKEPTKEDLKIGQNEVVYKYDEKYFDRDVIVKDDEYCYITINPDRSDDNKFEPYLIDGKRIIMTEEQVKSPKDLGLPNIIERSGYNFIGYSTTKLSPLDKNANIPDEVITFEKNAIECTGATARTGKAIELYVVWQKGDTEYTILHKKQNSQGEYETNGETENVSVETGTEIALKDITDRAKEYTGYSMNTVKTEQVFNNISSPIISGGSNRTFDLYYVRNKYIVNLSDTATIVSEYCTSKTPGSKYECTFDRGFRTSTPTKTGYTFTGWTCTGCDGNTSIWTDASSWTKWTDYATRQINAGPYLLANLTPTNNDEVTLNANWEPNTYTITLDNQGADISQGTDEIYLKYGVGYFSNSGATTSITTITPPQKTGYNFNGYYTNTNYTAQAIRTAGAIAIGNTATANNITLYAKWTPKTYTITLDNQGADISQGTTKIYLRYGVGYFSNSGATTSITTITPPQKTGYTFYGYGTGADYNNLNDRIINSVGTILAGKQTFTTANTTQIAKWRPNTYTISFNKNTTDTVGNIPGPQTKTHGINLALSSAVPTRTGYKFLGWSTSSTATSATWTAGSAYINNSGATLYAVWEQAYVTCKATTKSVSVGGHQLNIEEEFATGTDCNQACATLFSNIADWIDENGYWSFDVYPWTCSYPPSNYSCWMSYTNPETGWAQNLSGCHINATCPS